MMRTDICGFDVTCSPFALAAWERAVSSILFYRSRATADIEDLLHRSPDFAMGWALKGLDALTSRRPVDAREAFAQAERAIHSSKANARERLFVEALQLALAGKLWAAAGILAEISSRYAGDLLAVKFESDLRRVLGDRKGLQSAAEGALGATASDHPFRSFGLGLQAMACVENRLYHEAERSGRAAIECASPCPLGILAVAQVYDLTAQPGTGLAWLAATQEVWERHERLAPAIWWQRGLHLIELGEFDEVLDICDARFLNGDGDPVDMGMFATSLLTRLELEGVGVKSRTHRLIQRMQPYLARRSVVLEDLHYLLALYGGNRSREASSMTDRLKYEARDLGDDMTDIAATCGTSVALAIQDFRAGRYHMAFAALRRIKPLMPQLGGGVVQRDLLTRIMIEAGIRAGRYDEALRELEARAVERGAADAYTDRRRSAISGVQLGNLAAQ